MATIVETKELETIELLQTHYYKTCYEDLKDVYLAFLKNEGFNVVSIDDNYNEIFAEKDYMAVTAKIIEQTPRETSIDFYISSEFLFGNRKKSYRFIEEALTAIEKKHELKGLSLHK